MTSNLGWLSNYSRCSTSSSNLGHAVKDAGHCTKTVINQTLTCQQLYSFSFITRKLVSPRLPVGSAVDPLWTHLPQISHLCGYRLAGLVLKVPASGAEDPGFKSRLRRDFSESSHTSDFKIGTPVAALPDACRYRVSAGTGRPGVSIP